jgi:hypothetical protein
MGGRERGRRKDGRKEGRSLFPQQITRPEKIEFPAQITVDIHLFATNLDSFQSHFETVSRRVSPPLPRSSSVARFGIELSQRRADRSPPSMRSDPRISHPEEKKPLLRTREKQIQTWQRKKKQTISGGYICFSNGKNVEWPARGDKNCHNKDQS